MPDDEMCANFEKEAFLLAELNHADIIGLLGVCAVGKPMCSWSCVTSGNICVPSTYIAMVWSSALSSDFKDDKPSAAELTSMGRQIADGMVYLFLRGFVHCDLTTCNCLVNSVGPASAEVLPSR